MQNTIKNIGAGKIDEAHIAFKIIDKLRDYEAEIACNILGEILVSFPEIQGYVINNHIDVLQEEI